MRHIKLKDILDKVYKKRWVPEVEIKEGLSIHYSGGSSLSSDVKKISLMKINTVKRENNKDKDKNILKVTMVIIGTIIGAGFASRSRNIFIL